MFSWNTGCKVISYDGRCQNAPLSITIMYVIGHNENASLINHKIVCDQRTFLLCDLSQTLLLLQCCMSECSVINCGKGWLLGSR